jgi:hypothetical protein
MDPRKGSISNVMFVEPGGYARDSHQGQAKELNEAGPQMNLSWRNLEEGVFQIDIEVPQQGIRNQRVVPGRKVELLCIGERRTCVEQIFNSK